jgi:hypothetical protein
MAPLTFYYGSGSPYAWRVWLALEIKGFAYEMKTLSFDAGEHKQPGFLALNPRGRVPVPSMAASHSTNQRRSSSISRRSSPVSRASSPPIRVRARCSGA